MSRTSRLTTTGALLASVGFMLAVAISVSIAGLALFTTIPQAKSMTWDAVNAARPAKTECRASFVAD